MTGKASRRGKSLQKDRYNTLKAAGLCVTCKVPTGGGVRCDACQAKRIKYAKLTKIRKKIFKPKELDFPTNGLNLG